MKNDPKTAKVVLFVRNYVLVMYVGIVQFSPSKVLKKDRESGHHNVYLLNENRDEISK